MPPENALTNIRAEWVTESTTGETPSDPSWNRFSDYFVSYPGWSGEAGVEGQNAIGRGDLVDHFRGPEEHTLTLEYWLQRFFVDGAGTVVDPAAVPMTHDYQEAYPSHSILIRREVADGGADGAGFREFIVGRGCHPVSVSLPGDPSESQPIAEELEYQCERVRQFVVHQPASGTTLDLVSTDASDTFDVTIESEDATTTETITLSGTTTVTTTASFSDIDAIDLAAEPVGDITVSDGSGTTIAEFTGSDTTNIAGELGVPALGAGSHGSTIGGDPGEYTFLGTASTLGGSNLSESASGNDRVHALDLSVEVETTVENRQGSGRPVIDIGPRTAQAEVDIAGPYESAAQNRQYYRNVSGENLVYSLPGGDITLVNATRTDTDEVAREAGDANAIYGITLEGHGDPALTLTKT